MENKAAPYEADEPVYTVLDPRSREPEVKFRGLNPRLGTLAGKKIIVANLHGGNEEIMESIAADLKGAVGCVRGGLLPHQRPLGRPGAGRLGYDTLR